MPGFAKRDKIKYLLASLIVLGAFAILAPGLLGYLFGLWRLISLLVTMVIVAWLIVYIWHRFKPKEKEETDETKPNDDLLQEENVQ